jgi:hypothetical protein
LQKEYEDIKTCRLSSGQDLLGRKEIQVLGPGCRKDAARTRFVCGKDDVGERTGKSGRTPRKCSNVAGYLGPGGGIHRCEMWN